MKIGSVKYPTPLNAANVFYYKPALKVQLSKEELYSKIDTSRIILLGELHCEDSHQQNNRQIAQYLGADHVGLEDQRLLETYNRSFPLWDSNTPNNQKNNLGAKRILDRDGKILAIAGVYHFTKPGSVSELIMENSREAPLVIKQSISKGEESKIILRSRKLIEIVNSL